MAFPGYLLRVRRYPHSPAAFERVEFNVTLHQARHSKLPTGAVRLEGVDSHAFLDACPDCSPLGSFQDFLGFVYITFYTLAESDNHRAPVQVWDLNKQLTASGTSGEPAP